MKGNMEYKNYIDEYRYLYEKKKKKITQLKDIYETRWCILFSKV